MMPGDVTNNTANHSTLNAAVAFAGPGDKPTVAKIAAAATIIDFIGKFSLRSTDRAGSAGRLFHTANIGLRAAA